MEIKEKAVNKSRQQDSIQIPKFDVAKESIRQSVNYFSDVTSSARKLKKELKYRDINIFNSNWVATYHVAETLARATKDKETLDKLEEINENIRKNAAELGYETSNYSTKKLRGKNYQSVKDIIEADLKFRPTVFDDIDSATIDYILEIKSLLRQLVLPDNVGSSVAAKPDAEEQKRKEEQKKKEEQDAKDAEEKEKQKQEKKDKKLKGKNSAVIINEQQPAENPKKKVQSGPAIIKEKINNENNENEAAKLKEQKRLLRVQKPQEQTAQNEQKKIEIQQHNKIRNVGARLTQIGVALDVAGAAVAWVFGPVGVLPGIILGTIGVPSLAAGIPMWLAGVFIDDHRSKKAAKSAVSKQQ
ncbi:MAG: hypothetical protein ACP5RF_03070, partial [Candidatus Micrarchaeia archaeon]